MKAHAREYRWKDINVICIWRVRYDSCRLSKLKHVFHASVLLLIMNFVITLSKYLWIHEVIAEWIRRLATLTMLWRNLLSMTRQTHEKLASICSFTIINCQIPLSRSCSSRQHRISYKFRRLFASWQRKLANERAISSAVIVKFML